MGGPAIGSKLFFFSYYEGLRTRAGITTSATVPTAAQMTGDFSGNATPLLNLAAGGTPFPGGKLPPGAISAVGENVAKLYMTGNTSPSVYTSTLVGTNNYDQTGLRLDLRHTEADSYFLRYSYFTGLNLNPISVRGSDLPGFPTRDDFAVHSAVIGNTHLFGSHVSNNVQTSFFRYGFLFDQRLNRNGPRTLGFNYDSASAIGQGPPFFNLSGYSPVGGAITGPRTSVQNTYEVSDTMSVSHGGLGASPLREFRGDAYRGDNEISTRFRRWCGGLLFVGGVALIGLDAVSGFSISWPATIGARAFPVGLVLLLTEFVIVWDAKRKAGPAAGV